MEKRQIARTCNIINLSGIHNSFLPSISCIMTDMNYVITSLQKQTLDTYILRAKPVSGSILSFIAGQFCGIRQENEDSKTKAHFFSIASSPTNKKYIEFCFKIYGNWTKRLSQTPVNSTLALSGPYGKFTWEKTFQTAIFLAGGVGITPFMSMLRFIKETNQTPSITLLYGNGTEQHILYKNGR